MRVAQRKLRCGWTISDGKSLQTSDVKKWPLASQLPKEMTSGRATHMQRQKSKYSKKIGGEMEG